MKKVIAIIAVALASFSIAHAQFGIVGGFTSSSTKVNTQDWKANLENISLYHVGLTYKMDLGMGLAIQPALTYEVKGASADFYLGADKDTAVAENTIDTKSGYAEFGLDLQWGPDLMIARPFIFASPFVGYMLTQEETNNLTAVQSVDQEQMNEAVENAKNKLEYGFGIGAGLDILQFVQLKGQFYMNLGNLYDEGKIDGKVMTEAVKNSYKDISNYSGFKVSLSILLF